MAYPRRATLPTRVRSVTDVTSGLREVELTGPDLSSVRCRPGAHLTLLLPAGRRVYSIWRHDPRAASLSIRVVLHDEGGPGCEWARAVRPDDRLTAEPPRSKITLDETAAFHLFIGDETGAVPLMAMRAALPRDARVHGVFESAGPEGEMPGTAGMRWVHRGRASAVGSRVLLRGVQETGLPEIGGGAAYVAGESATCRLIQRHLIEQRGWPRRAVRVQQQWAPGRPGFGAGRDEPDSAGRGRAASVRGGRPGRAAW